jgi:hypothetical protein
MSRSGKPRNARPGSTRAGQSRTDDSAAGLRFFDTLAQRAGALAGIAAGVFAIVYAFIENIRFAVIAAGIALGIFAALLVWARVKAGGGKNLAWFAILLSVTCLIAGGLEGGVIGYFIASSPPASLPPDNAAPSIPAGLKVTETQLTHVDLSWDASTDNVGVSGYVVLRDGKRVSEADSSSFSDTSVRPATHYSYQVEAFDAAGNHSQPSGPVSVNTLSRVNIDSPTDGQKVPESFPVSGTYQDLRSGEEVWVLLNPDGKGYFPQNGPARAAPGSGTWQNQDISLGGESGTPAEVRVVVAMTEDVQTQFREFVATCRQGACPPALEVLPGRVSCEPGGAVSVTTKSFTHKLTLR